MECLWVCLFSLLHLLVRSETSDKIWIQKQCCEKSNLDDYQLKDCLLQYIYDDAIYNSYNLSKIFSSSTELMMNYHHVMKENYWNENKFLLFDSWMDFNRLLSCSQGESVCREDLFLILLMPSTIILEMSPQLYSFDHSSHWNIIRTPDLILFRLHPWTLRLLEDWKQYSETSGELTPQYSSFISFTNSQSFFCQNDLSSELCLGRVLSRPSTVLVNNSQILITSIHDEIPSTRLFLLGKISPTISAFERNLTLPLVWRSMCEKDPGKFSILNAFSSKEMPKTGKATMFIEQGLVQLLDLCKSLLEQSKEVCVC
jgi:hypothetical protein